jgi:uncharacterized protein (DUF2267 family)
MNGTGLDVFDTTTQKTRIWLNDLMEILEWKDKPRKAYIGLRAVLHALRDRLTIQEAVQLGAQLPLLIRGVYYEGWKLTGKPVRERHKEEFLDHIKRAFRDDTTVDPEKVARAVFQVLSKRTSSGEIEDVRHMLPTPVQRLWPQGRNP